MTIKIQFDSSSEIGTFINLTNTFCIVPVSLSKKVFIAIKSELGENFPILFSNVLNSKCQGRLIACNSKGILVDGLFDICRSKLLIQHVQFQKDLRELKEQNIISFSSFGANQDGRQYFSVPLHSSVLMSLVGSKNNQSK